MHTMEATQWIERDELVWCSVRRIVLDPPNSVIFPAGMRAAFLGGWLVVADKDTVTVTAYPGSRVLEVELIGLS